MSDLRKRKTKQVIPRWFFITITVVFVLGLALIAFIFIFNEIYKNKITPGIKVGGIDLGGKTRKEAHDLLQNKVNEIIDKGLIFDFQEQKVIIPSSVEDEANLELSSNIITFDINQTIKHIFQVMKAQNEAEKVIDWIRGIRIPVSYQLDESKLKEGLITEVGKYENPATNARLVIEGDDLSIGPEESGQAFDYQKIFGQVKSNLNKLDQSSIKINLEVDRPEITRINAEPALSIVGQVFDSAPFILQYQDKKWAFDLDKIKTWLEFQKQDGQITVGLKESELTKYLEEISKDINIEAKEAKFTMKDSKVTEFQASQTGLTLDIDKSMAEINKKISWVGIKEIDLQVQEKKPSVSMEDMNDYGIKELIGEGRSNFKGSPKNRKHNIGVGAGALNGILIKPSEEFSLNKAIGKVDASTGYKPELVIKGNKTIPEFGGGLCQIGTTAFRVALNSGLPITKRTNHSYRVSYYEPPAGMDATIYDPAPDFRFINDTGHYILFQTEIAGNELIFRFYGTKDGRKAEMTTPRLYNYVKPGPSKLIETLDLRPGEKKCTERAHIGADAEFTYKVTYLSGEVKTQVFKSHYKPWQEVCLIGVEKLSEEPKE